MITPTTSRKGWWISLNERRAARTAVLLLLLLLTLPSVVQAQFYYTTNNGTITIMLYEGPGGAVTIPSMIDGYPVTSIGDEAFYACFSLTSVTIPAGVTGIGVEVFAFCSSLTAITVDANNPAYTSVAGVLFDKSQTTLVAYLGGVAEPYAIPGSVTSIDDYAFCLCKLANITIPNSVTNIGNGAFDDCRSLTSATIPSSVTAIGSYAFFGCRSLTAVSIGRRVISIGSDAFAQCKSLSAITVDALNPVYSSAGGVLFNKSQTTLVTYPGGKAGSYTIPGSVTSIGELAFSYCTGLTSITIPNSVTNLGIGAFEESSLTSVTIGNSVTNIADFAFDSCISLTNVTIPNSVTAIGHDAFTQCYGLTSITIPNGVTSIGGGAFSDCEYLTNVTIGNGLTSIADDAFDSCSSLTSVTIPNSVTSIEGYAFFQCTSLTTVTVGNSVTNIADFAFEDCTSLRGLYLQGNAPGLGWSVFSGDTNATVYYVPGTAGWGPTFGGLPTARWIQAPTILISPQTQTAEAGSAVGLQVKASGSLPMFCLWYLNYTNLISCNTNCELELTDIQFSQSGAYTVVITNAAGVVTSAPVMLNVIAAVERRPVPGVKVTGQTGSLLNVDYANSLSPAPNWTPLGSVSLTGTSGYCFDVALPLPPQRFYRAWQTGTPGVAPSLSLPGMVPAITLTGSIGDSWRVDYINRFGPTDAWVTLATVTLTNTPQLYFDVSAPGQPQRLYRLVPSP